MTFFQLDVAILTIPSEKSIVTDSTKKEKRGVLGFGVHGHHHHSHHHHPEHYDDWHHLPPPPPPPHPPHLAHPSVPLGSHFHTTITKKVGIPYPVPVKVAYMYSRNIEKVQFIGKLLFFKNFLLHVQNSLKKKKKAEGKSFEHIS